MEAFDLSITYESARRSIHALGPVDLRVASGEFVAIVGPSGCGKSTLLKVAAGILAPGSGSMTVRAEGRPGSVVSKATVFQDYGIFPWKTVQRNVEFGLEINGVTREETRTVARRWIHQLGLAGFEDAYPATLSGGMKQRVSIARALAVSPELLLMDEPFAALDAQLRDLMQEELLALHQSDQRTVMFVTHSLEEALFLADRVVVLSARPGRIIAERAVPFGRPRNTDVRQAQEFAAIKEQLWQDLKAQVIAANDAETEEEGARQ